MKNNIKKLLEQVIVDVLREESQDAPEGSVYGKYLFAPHRKDLKPDEMKEPNTENEKDLFAGLESWYGDSRHGGEDLEHEIDNIIKSIESGLYKQFLVAPKSQIIYRFLLFPLFDKDHVSDIKSVLNVEENEIIHEKNKPHTTNKSGIIKSNYNHGFMSWSAASKADLPEVAHSVYGNVSRLATDGCIIILKTTVNDSNGFFFINPKNMEKINGLNQYINEEEIISYGPVIYENAAYIFVDRKVKIMTTVEDLLKVL